MSKIQVYSEGYNIDPGNAINLDISTVVVQKFPRNFCYDPLTHHTAQHMFMTYFTYDTLSFMWWFIQCEISKHEVDDSVREDSQIDFSTHNF